MSWTAPFTWTGALVAVAKLNEQLRDNMLALNSIPAACVYNNADQGVLSDTLVPLTFNTERWDTDTIHDTGTNPTRLTCKTAGRYEIKGMIAFEANTTGWRTAYFRLNGTTLIAAIRVMAVTTASVDTYLHLSKLWPLAVNDYVELIAYHNVGTAINALTVFTEFEMQRTSE